MSSTLEHLFDVQVVGVLDAMPSSNLKPEEEDGVLEENRVYRTTYMFSATMPPPVERLARKYMRRPAVINIGSAGKATDNVTQKVRPPFSESDLERIPKWLLQMPFPPQLTVSVFCMDKGIVHQFL